MRLGCAAYSYRDYLNAAKMTLEGFVDECARLELDGVELTSYYFASTEPSSLHELKRHCMRRGQHILGTAVGSNFTQVEAGKRREHVEMTKAWIDRSVVLGAPCIRVFAGSLPADVEEGTAFGWALECIQECVEHGSQRGVAVALENHGGVTGKADQVGRFLSAIDSPWFGLNLDFGNFVGEPYADFAVLAPRTITTHVKVTADFGGVHKEVDYDRVVEIMKSAGYDGYLSIEYEEDGDPLLEVPKFAGQLRRALTGMA